MKAPFLSLPAKRASAWVAETDPKYARAWLESLPLTNCAESAREIYQSLYTLNRLELPGSQRRELMELYRAPVAMVINGLQAHLAQAAQPLSPKKRQLAEFIRQLQMEMAYGYKWCLRDVAAARLPWGKDEALVAVAERSLYYLRELLVRSYSVYLPHPPNVWRELHEIFCFLEARALDTRAVEVRGETGVRAVTVRERYVQALLLGASQPYQLPQNACQQLCLFIDTWGQLAQLSAAKTVDNPVGHFLVDFGADAPPTPYPRGTLPAETDRLRMLSVIDLVRVTQGFIGRLKQGERTAALRLGFDCLEDNAVDLLQRLVWVWGLTPRRRYQRLRRNSYISVCVGVPALHFFANGQQPLSDSPLASARVDAGNASASNGEVAYVELDDEPPPAPTIVTTRTPYTNYRLDRWHMRDANAQGMLLARYSDSTVTARVGDLLGLHQPGMAHWTVAVVRWLKSPEGQSLELGVELLAPMVTPVAVRAEARNASYMPALLLPATTTPRRPISLLLPRGAFTARQRLWLSEAGRPERLIAPVQLLERSVAYDRIAFADAPSA